MNRSRLSASVARVLIVSIGAWAGTATLAADAPKTVAVAVAEKVRAIEGVTEYRLPNGLQVLLFPDDSSSTVTTNVTYKVGSRHESYGETGMAHLLEHMNFKGTPSHLHIYAELSGHGASANASTSYDRTNYFETLPASTANLEWALGLEADRMTHSFIAKKDLDSEMTVVRNEFEKGENDPGHVLQERVLETAYLWHNYGHPTIGARADIEGVPINRLQAFYRTYYQPDNAALIVTGKFDQKATLHLIERVFGAIPKPTRLLPAVYTAEPTQDGEREVTLRRSGSQQILVEAFHVPADAHRDSASLNVLAAMLNEQPAGLLYKRLIEPKLAVSASVGLATLFDPGFLMISVTLPKNGDLAAVRRELAGVIGAVRGPDLPKEDLERVVNKRFNDYERILNSSPQVADLLSESVAVGDWRLAFWDRDRLHEVTVEDVARAANTYLVDSNRSVGIFIPDDNPVRAAITPAPRIDTLLADYAGQAAAAEGEHFVATPRAIEARIKRGMAGRIKTAYLVKKTRGDRVTGVLMFHFGNLQLLQNKADVAVYTSALLMRGTQLHSRQALQDELTRLKATMAVGGGASGVSMSFETTKDNLTQVLKLAAEILQQPAFPAADLDEMKRSSLTRIEAARTDPNAIAGLAVQRYLSAYPPGDFRYVATLDEHSASIQIVTIADVQGFHTQFYGASVAEAALVGDFDVSTVTQQLTELFGAWKSGTAYERALDVYNPTIGKSQTFATPDKANAIYIAGSNLNLRDDDPDYPALMVGNEILGGGFLSSRLATRIRQKDGLSYTVASQLSADSLDPVGSFSIYAICAPQNAAKVESDVQEEITRAIADGFTASEIAGAKSGILQSLSVARSNDATLARDLVNHLFRARDFNWDVRLEKSIESASPESVRKAVQRFIVPAHWVTVKAGDFSKVEN